MYCLGFFCLLLLSRFLLSTVYDPMIYFSYIPLLTCLFLSIYLEVGYHLCKKRCHDHGHGLLAEAMVKVTFRRVQGKQLTVLIVIVVAVETVVLNNKV